MFAHHIFTDKKSGFLPRFSKKKKDHECKPWRPRLSIFFSLPAKPLDRLYLLNYECKKKEKL
jgi:hypothetical protein